MNQPRQAIFTTRRQGSKGNPYILAKAYAGKLAVPWNHELNTEENHYAAGLALARLYGWDNYNDYVLGSLTEDYVLVAVEKEKSND